MLIYFQFPHCLGVVLLQIKYIFKTLIFVNLLSSLLVLCIISFPLCIPLRYFPYNLVHSPNTHFCDPLVSKQFILFPKYKSWAFYRCFEHLHYDGYLVSSAYLENPPFLIVLFTLRASLRLRLSWFWDLLYVLAYLQASEHVTSTLSFATH